MEFLLLASAHFLALLSPGPDFFLIIQASIRLPKRYGTAVCAGIATANFIYLTFAVFGIELIKNWTILMVSMKYLGACYLIFLGIMLLRTPARPLLVGESPGFLLVHDWKRQYSVGFLSGILNPKNAIFYLSLFTVMVSETTSLQIRCFYALWMTTIVFSWDMLVLSTFGRKAVQQKLGRGVFVIEKLSGVVLTFFGLLLPFT